MSWNKRRLSSIEIGDKNNLPNSYNKRNKPELELKAKLDNVLINNKVSQKVKQFYNKEGIVDIQSESASSDYSKDGSAAHSKQSSSKIDKISK